ncbi:MAG: ABC transporter permease subunit [Actinomycetota bacterium]|nr:ABC transporter permease subunit [Actinomycetota bacterium]
MSAEPTPDPAAVVVVAPRRSLWRRARRSVMFVVSMALVAAAWEAYKKWGPQDGGEVLGWKILPRAKDRVMPHISDIFSRFTDPLNRASDETVLEVVLKGVWFSFRLVLAGFGMGLVAGMLLAIVMTRFRFAERAVLPYLVVSQTVPLIALAPLVASWGGKLELFGWEWPRWMSSAVLGAFLTFFPIAVGTLRGLQSPTAASLELMDSLAAPWRRTLVTLRFPAAVPYIVPALKLGAAGAVIGVVVSEISTGLRGGIGRLVIEFSQKTTGDPAIVYTAVLGAAFLGLVLAGMVAIADAVFMRNRPKEVDA